MELPKIDITKGRLLHSERRRAQIANVIGMDEKIEIMKSLLQRAGEKKWNLRDLQTLTLKPRAGFNNDYFKMEGEMNLLTNSPGGMSFADLFSTLFRRLIT